MSVTFEKVVNDSLENKNCEQTNKKIYQIQTQTADQDGGRGEHKDEKH